MLPNLSFSYLLSQVDTSKIATVSVSDYYYRVVSVKRSPKPLATMGAVLTGGRYNYKAKNDKSFPTLYCSDVPVTAEIEKYYKLIAKNEPLPPHTTVALKVDLKRVWDLSSLQKCQRAGVDWKELNDEWEYYQDIEETAAYPQLIGSLAYQSEVEGILFESTKNRGHFNLAIFTELTAKDAVELHDPNGEIAALFANA